MDNFKVEKKDSFRFVGFKTKLEGASFIHSDGFSDQKTEFFKSVVQSGKMASLQPISESKNGYAVVKSDGKNTFYYAGVLTSQPVKDDTEEVLFREGDYLVLSGKGGLSRLAFDRLEDQAFNEIFNEEFPYELHGEAIAEVLLNGNPLDSEVELWIPVKTK
ncbi:effector binding domain-containing protein [Robertmurraya sp. DFI.2.37]|uniref:GyrI-like domain-containing protein n=1 Tax=Robertmurraya sp. DFI.2.37 TaxID=3031819 RepID=UPI0023DB66FD|nr:effector binding domain-containing protein [Robertmurraya sp. DFI.2.37]MDF1510030.1 effector binding domain-containing protein [Robertmurraya sp. DFI.2.37]